MEATREREQLLALKVMRLTKPALTLNHPITCDTSDLPKDSFNHVLKNDLTTVQDAPNLGIGELMTLPQNFGNIFLGETFSSYISVHNDSSQICRDVMVKADLQTSLQRLSLSGASNEPVPELPPNTSIDDVIHHEVKELGTHILVCAVTYTTASGEKMYFRKFFKFQVLKPLDLKPKFYNAESDEVYLEAQIQNTTPSPIYLETVSMDPSPEYVANELNQVPSENGKEKKLVYGKVNVLNPMDTRQYLYCLTPKPELYGESKIIKGVTNIGKLDIVWKTSMGEKGRLQTSPLQRVAPGYGDIRLTVEYMPDAIPVEKPFNVTYKVTNCSDRTMDLTLALENTRGCGLLWSGLSGRQLGKLGPSESKKLNLGLIGICQGLQTISGLKLTDTFLKRTYEHDEIAQIFIYSSNSNSG
ncbi:trafficking protein particle complex subunit 13-like isoform X2 [Lineus longissimus]|uniref:trafficking protein particle complex subunit 13-like isoform X2 n=1 Tax=Lineus longissimus TaxID=88925 RepID=UPI00315CEDD0